MIDYKHSEWQIAGRTVYGEARSEPFDGQVAVAWVLRNRVEKGGWWGKTVETVCLKPNQFSCWNTDDPNRDIILLVSENEWRFRRALGIVALVFSGDLHDPTDGATHYWTSDRPAYASHWPPSWAAAYKTSATIGAHVFQREFRDGEMA